LNYRDVSIGKLCSYCSCKRHDKQFYQASKFENATNRCDISFVDACFCIGCGSLSMNRCHVTRRYILSVHSRSCSVIVSCYCLKKQIRYRKMTIVILLNVVSFLQLSIKNELLSLCTLCSYFSFSFPSSSSSSSSLSNLSGTPNIHIYAYTYMYICTGGDETHRERERETKTENV
jgi:hypothetical protein